MNYIDYPALYQDADAASLKAQTRFLGALSVSLLLLVFAAILTLLNLPTVWFATLQAATLSGSLGLSIYLAHNQPQRTWYGTRALAESVKTVCWRYMMRAEPYEVQGHAAKDELISTLRRLIRDNRFAAHVPPLAEASQVTPFMDRARGESLGQRKQLYGRSRIEEQLKWYKKKANWNDRRAVRWSWVVGLLQVAAIGCAIGRLWEFEFVYWPIDVFVAATAASVAWSQTKRFQELAASYSLTAHEIGSLKAKLQNVSTEVGFSHFVGDAENAFSREHTQWRARRDVL